tara:strand:+ start:5937 stop:6116 length:180 start_codon:yes stop_codon:yes gene_type:complete
MTKLKKWDHRVLSKGNGIKWESHRSWFGFFAGKTQFNVVGAWGRKVNLLFSGRWKGSNA